jgi:hypothetical protein
MLRAQSDHYLSVGWEEIASQLRETFERSCLPLLGVINFDDIRKYVALSQINERLDYF